MTENQPARSALFAVLFDNDGVLVNSEPLSGIAYLRGIEEQGLKLTDADLERNTGLTDADIVTDLQEHYGVKLDEELFSKRKAVIYKELVMNGKLEAFAGTRRLLESLRDAGIPYALASSGSPGKIRFNLEQAGIADLIPVYVSGEELERGKPDPDVFLKAAAKVHVDPSRCFAIEDSLNGLRAARAAGMFAIGITNTFPRQKLEPLADLVIDSLDELTVERLSAIARRPG